MPKPKMRRFRVPLIVDIEVSQSLLDSVLTDEWRDIFYKLYKPEQVAEMLAFNLGQGRRLVSLDGFGDQPEDAARMRNIESEDAEEIEPPRPKRQKTGRDGVR